MLIPKSDVIALHYLWIGKYSGAKRGRIHAVMLTNPQGAYKLTGDMTLKEARRWMRGAARRAEKDTLLLDRQALELAKAISPSGYGA